MRVDHRNVNRSVLVDASAPHHDPSIESSRASTTAGQARFQTPSRAMKPDKIHECASNRVMSRLRQCEIEPDPAVFASSMSLSLLQSGRVVTIKPTDRGHSLLYGGPLGVGLPTMGLTGRGHAAICPGEVASIRAPRVPTLRRLDIFAVGELPVVLIAWRTVARRERRRSVSPSEPWSRRGFVRAQRACSLGHDSTSKSCRRSSATVDRIAVLPKLTGHARCRPVTWGDGPVGCA